MVAAEARGFLLGPALALELGAGFVLARKPGKLPYETVSAEYLLEYGAGAARAAHRRRRQRARACSCTTTCSRPAARPRALCELVEQLGGEVVGCGFLIELAFLDGRARLRAARRPRAAQLRVLSARTSRWPAARRSRTIAAPAAGAVGDARDPHHLPRWWPRVTRVEDVADGAFTEVMKTKKGKLVRADFDVRRDEAEHVADLGAAGRGDAVRARAQLGRDRAAARAGAGAGGRRGDAR